MELFSFPAIYDTAFQFRDKENAIDFIEWCIKTYTEIPVYSVVDIACGTGHYTREFARRNYNTYGVDINYEVCQYAQGRAFAESLDMTILCGDMVNFSLPVRCDLAVSFFDSLTYLADMHSLATHFTTVSRVLSPGGLYIVELGVIDHFDNHNVEEVWTEVRRDFSVTATYCRDAWISPANNTFEEECSFRAVCREHVAFFHVKFLKLALYFKELDQIVKQTGVFTPIAYYDDFDPETLLDDDVIPWRVVAVFKRQ
jgi:SAM-dependent methyltransferase